MHKLLSLIKPTQILPLVLILIDLGAAAAYAKQHDYRKVIYWVAAAVLNAAVTF